MLVTRLSITLNAHLVSTFHDRLMPYPATGMDLRRSIAPIERNNVMYGAFWETQLLVSA